MYKGFLGPETTGYRFSALSEKLKIICLRQTPPQLRFSFFLAPQFICNKCTDLYFSLSIYSIGLSVTNLLFQPDRFLLPYIQPAHTKVYVLLYWSTFLVLLHITLVCTGILHYCISFQLFWCFFFQKQTWCCNCY